MCKRYVYRMDTVKECVCQKWFAKFCAEDFSLKDASRSGRSQEVDNDQLKNLIECNSCYTTRDIAQILKISKSSVENHLHGLGFMHALTETNRVTRISI